MPGATRRLPRQAIRSRIALPVEVPGKDGKSSLPLVFFLLNHGAITQPVRETLQNAISGVLREFVTPGGL
jgi:hypothetical protein